MQKVTLNAQPKASMLHALKLKLMHEVFSNWRLVLLGITGLVLSVASGWTTWEGMNNFTKTPALSILITFGIQGVMLTTAWLIGESFASGMTGDDGAARRSTVDVLLIAKRAFFLIVSVAALMGLVFLLVKAFGISEDALNGATGWISQNLPAIIISLASILAMALLLVVFSEADIIGPYARGVRTILNHLPLWLMFLSCMATSVFFSFDSLFSSIFPEQERQRAGELRTQNAVSGIITDLSARIEDRRGQAIGTLFGSTEWSAYERNLNKLIKVARSAPAAVEERYIAELKKRQTSLAKQTVSMSEAKASANRLAAEKTQLENGLKRAENELSRYQEDIAKFENELQGKTREYALAKAAVKAELRGVGSSGQSGKGPRYRELQKAVVRGEIEMSAIRQQLSEVRGKFAARDKRLINQRARIVAIATQLSELKAQELAAKGQIEAQERLQKERLDPSLNASAGFKTLEKVLTQFRQEPTQARLHQLQGICGDLHTTLNTVPKLQSKTRDIDCDPGRTSNPASRVFSHNLAQSKFAQTCGDAAKMPTDTDALIAFTQKCILTSGLPSKITRAYRSTINHISLNRDDKAENFVVTWNAFADGNRLAYLALAIAVAIDSLVFMSGLFGANILTSPLASSPKARGQPITQLQDMVDNALLPDKAWTADLTLNLMRPYSDPNDEGYMAEVDLEGLVSQQFLSARKVMVAGSNLGLVFRDPHAVDRFLIRSELFEYLSIVRAREAKLGNLSGKDATPRLVSEESLPVISEPGQPPVSGHHLPDAHNLSRPQPIAEQHTAQLPKPTADTADHAAGHETAAPAKDPEEQEPPKTAVPDSAKNLTSTFVVPSDPANDDASPSPSPKTAASSGRDVSKIDYYNEELEAEWYEIREAFHRQLDIRSTVKKELKKLCSGSEGKTPQQLIDRFVREDVALEPYFSDIERFVSDEIDNVEAELFADYGSRPDMLNFVQKVAAEFRTKMPAIILLKVNRQLQDKAEEVQGELQDVVDAGLADDIGNREQIDYFLEQLAIAENTRCKDMMVLRESVRDALDLLEQIESRASA